MTIPPSIFGPPAVLVLSMALAAFPSSPAQPEPRPPIQTPPSPARTPTASAPIAGIPTPGLDARLAALSPARPDEYYLLAEEVASERQAPGARDLARRLFVLALELDRRRGTPSSVSSSACIALAHLASSESERRWLRAMAAELESGSQRPDDPQLTVRIDPPRTPERIALQIGAGLSLLRSGEGRRALQILEAPGVWSTLEAFEALLSPKGESGESAKIRRWAGEWAVCPQCRNARVVPAPDASGGSSRKVVCPTCNGAPGPVLTRDELVGQLRLEAALLRGTHRLWSTQVLADAGETLRDPLPEDVAIIYHVDASLVLWRGGQWVADPSAPPLPPPKPRLAPDPKPPAAAPPEQQGG